MHACPLEETLGQRGYAEIQAARGLQSRCVMRNAIAFVLVSSLLACSGPGYAGAPDSFSDPIPPRDETHPPRSDHAPPTVDAAPVTPPPATPPPPVTCRIGTQAFSGANEQLTIGSRVFGFGADGVPASTNGQDLVAIARYAAGPCRGNTTGQCSFETRTFATIDGREVESITSNGRYWNFAGDIAYTDNGSDLTAVRRYAAGPCAGKTTCAFETRTFRGKTEAITAYGRIWNFEGETPWSINGTALETIPRYASGPCAGAAAGACRFDTRTFGVESGQAVEIVTARGLMWRWHSLGADDGQPLPGNPISLSSIPRYAPACAP